MFLRFFFIYLAVHLCFISAASDAAAIVRAEAPESNQLSSQEVEKWLEEFSQYLERLEAHGFPETRHSPLMPAGAMQDRQWFKEFPARKRNAELINNLLGLPRIMKVVG